MKRIDNKIRIKVQISNKNEISQHGISYPVTTKRYTPLVDALDAVKDTIMGLNVGESIYFRSILNDASSKGIITRIE
jgi:hypothetical protein